MSKRNRDGDVLMPPRQERKAHAHSERHRIHVELQGVAQEVSAGADPADVHEPGAAWKPMKHHDAEVAKSKLAKRSRGVRHWKTKDWKRRTLARRARIAKIRMVRENPATG